MLDVFLLALWLQSNSTTSLEDQVLSISKRNPQVLIDTMMSHQQAKVREDRRAGWRTQLMNLQLFTVEGSPE